MTVRISRKESVDLMLRKMDRLEKRSRSRQQKAFAELSGKLKKTFKGDPVQIQKKLRDEWEK